MRVSSEDTCTPHNNVSFFREGSPAGRLSTKYERGRWLPFFPHERAGKPASAHYHLRSGRFISRRKHTEYLPSAQERRGRIYALRVINSSTNAQIAEIHTGKKVREKTQMFQKDRC